MLISIAATTFDPSGFITIETLPDNNNGITKRRVNRTPTLDQDVVINDGGYVEGDRTLTYTWKTVSKDHNDAIDRMVRLYSLVNVFNDRGAYLAAPETFIPDPDESSITLLVKSKLSA